MLCDNCGQNNASVRYTQIVNGIRKEMNLCYECSNKLNLNEFSFSVPFSFSNFFENFLNDYDNSVVLPMIICPPAADADDELSSVFVPSPVLSDEFVLVFLSPHAANERTIDADNVKANNFFFVILTTSSLYFSSILIQV